MVRLLFFRLQPIEILKPFFILATVKVLTFNKLKSSQLRYLVSFSLLSLVIILLIDQPDLGQTVFFFLLGLQQFSSPESVYYIYLFFL